MLEMMIAMSMFAIAFGLAISDPFFNHPSRLCTAIWLFIAGLVALGYGACHLS